MDAKVYSAGERTSAAWPAWTAAKILVTCEVTITAIGSNSGTGEEWSDEENALTAAEAQPFKRALSCFGLGRYLYDVEGQWVEFNEHGLPKKTAQLPRWATPNDWESWFATQAS